MSPSVRISEIGLYLRCPRLVYFQNLGSIAAPEDATRMLLRALMFSLSSQQSSQLSAVDLQSLLKENLALLEQELPLIYEIDSALVESACRDLQPEIESISQGLAGSLDLLLPCEVEVDLYSEKLGLSGRLDRLAHGGIPSIIRTGRAPESGIWKKDRIMLSGYALLLGEKEKRHVPFGLVEYARQGLIRRVEIHGTDRARALRIRDRIRLIKQGRLPDRPDDAPCKGCQAEEICRTRHSLASKFF
ncbi:MAG: Dna2/Cas4 domain-containing protein [Methanothrix sp.]|nr:Dna2/Cas4 domain-containing protein [Methanothrix sp.]HNQ54322.1 PD-(D/E)XK nuclease family protein [Methanothrix sp.]HPH48592.1 PD-(D/E)XK nuclease family protein [Methanothrix sp.]